MNVKSLSIVVPINRCVNKCPFCVSKNNPTEYEDYISKPIKKGPKKAINCENFKQYVQRLQFAAMEGYNNLIITGTGEPLQNKKFITSLPYLFLKCFEKFKWIEFQTTGFMLNDDNTIAFLRKQVGVKTISLSVCDLFYNDINHELIGTPKSIRHNLLELCMRIKSHNLNLRICVNLWDNFHLPDAKILFERLYCLQADMVTFRVLTNPKGSINNWVINNTQTADYQFQYYKKYVIDNGTLLEKIGYGFNRYSIHGISTVFDDDCLVHHNKYKKIRHLILRPDCRLYTRWDDKGSLLF